MIDLANRTANRIYENVGYDPARIEKLVASYEVDALRKVQWGAA